MKSNGTDVMLSQRETQCLGYLTLGHSTKEIANVLDLSPRTIESYLNNIKQKTGYFCRSRLVTEFTKNAPSTFLKCYVK